MKWLFSCECFFYIEEILFGTKKFSGTSLFQKKLLMRVFPLFSFLSNTLSLPHSHLQVSFSVLLPIFLSLFLFLFHSSASLLNSSLTYPHLVSALSFSRLNNACDGFVSLQNPSLNSLSFYLSLSFSPSFVSAVDIKFASRSRESGTETQTLAFDWSKFQLRSNFWHFFVLLTKYIDVKFKRIHPVA